MAQTSADGKHHKRRWLRFSLRSLMLFVFGAGVVLATLGREIARAQRQHTAVVAIVSAGGAVWYNSETKQGEESAWVRWLRDIVHEDCFVHVDRVEMRSGTLDLDQLFRRIELEGKLGLSKRRTEFTDQSIDQLSTLRELRQLSLRFRDITDVGRERLAPLSNLESLNLSRTKVSNSGLRHLRALQKLRHLDLSGTAVTDEGLSDLSELPDLEELVVGVTFDGEGRNRKRIEAAQITDDGVVRLAGLRQLRGLNLRGTRVTDDGLGALRTLDHLTTLDLIETRVTDAGVAFLEDYQGLQTVKLVEEIPILMGPGPLTETVVTEAGVEQLRKRKPGLTIEYTSPRSRPEILSIEVPSLP